MPPAPAARRPGPGQPEPGQGIYTRYIPVIYDRWSYDWYIPGIYPGFAISGDSRSSDDSDAGPPPGPLRHRGGPGGPGGADEPSERVLAVGPYRPH